MDALECLLEIEQRQISINYVGNGTWHASVELLVRQRPSSMPEMRLVWALGYSSVEAVERLCVKLRQREAIAA
jgi:hypothetical protein